MQKFSPLSFPEFNKGAVWMVGAGPGDPKLLTLYAYYALQRADIILYDSLIGADCLALAPDSTPKYCVGKRGGQPSWSQDRINQTLIDHAQAGKAVLRLKGGDPFVFGRSVEEARPLLKANIPLKIIPAVSAGIAGSAYAGVPLSSAETNQSFSFISAHDASGSLPALNWPALSAGSPVLVFYMPLKQKAAIRHALLDAGRPENEGVCFVSHATTAQQKALYTTLGACLDDFAKAPLTSPALMIVGPTVMVHDTFVNIVG